MYQNNPNLNMVMMPFPNTQPVMAPLYSRVPIQSEEEQPMYVNAKQYHRILKRRQARAKQDSMNPNHRKRGGYLHQSRHNHACKRPRGEGGRFLSKDSANKQQQQQQQQVQSPDQLSSPNQTLSALTSLISQQQSPTQQQPQPPPPLQQPTPQQAQQQPQNHKIKSSKHSQSSSPQSTLSATSPTNDVNISNNNNSSFKREISPQISIITPNSNTGDQHNIGINSADDVTSSQSQGFQQFQSPFQQLQQQIQIQPSTSDNDSKTEQAVSGGSMADGGLPPLDKDILDNWGY